MPTKTLATSAVAGPPFPAEQVRARLREELQKAAREGGVLRPEWEPLLDSLRMVSALLKLEDLFPFKIPPDKLVRKGGYNSVEEGVDDMLERSRRIWNDRGERKVR